MSDQVITPSFYRALTSTRGLHNLIVSSLRYVLNDVNLAANFASLPPGRDSVR